jgi:hypothetical protein
MFSRRFRGGAAPWEHAARMMRSSSRCCCWFTSTPAFEQSSTRIDGVDSHVCRSYTDSGMYCA